MYAQSILLKSTRLNNKQDLTILKRKLHLILLHKLVTCIHYNALFDSNDLGLKMTKNLILFIRSTDGQLVVAVIDKGVPCSVKEEKVRILTSAAP